MSGEIDLSELQLLPQWAKEPLQQNPYQNYEGETSSPRDRDRRGGRDDRGRGGPGHRPDSRGPNSQRPPQNRGPRPEGGRNAGPRPSGPRRDSDRDRRPGNRNDRFQRDDRQEQRPPENLPPLEVLFQPEPHGADSMVKQIKSSGRSYPVFELARMILKKPERHQVVLQVPAPATPETPPVVSLFVCEADHSLWLSEADAVQHTLQKHLGKFYQAEQVAIDAPKGNFNCIGVCGMSGKVLGPPNHHDYPAAVRRLYVERFSNMSFEDFKSRIRLVKDEAVLNQWKEQQSTKTEYLVKSEIQSEAKVEIPAPVETPGETTEPVAVVVVDAPATEEVAEEATEASAPEDAQAAEPAPIEEADPQPVAETPAPAPVEKSPATRLPNLEAVRSHFIKEYQAKQIRQVSSFVLTDFKARQQSDPVIQKIIRRAWDSEVRFPAKTGPALIHSLSKNGLQFFKWNKGITHVASVRPKRFDPAKSPVAEGVSKILDWVATHPGKTRADLLQALAPETPAAAPAPVVEKTSPAAASGAPTASSPAPVVETPTPEASVHAASAVLSDLHWLLHEGYIVEFANNQLDLLRQNEKTAKAPNAPAPAKESAASATPSAPVAETPAVADEPASESVEESPES